MRIMLKKISSFLGLFLVVSAASFSSVSAVSSTASADYEATFISEDQIRLQVIPKPISSTGGVTITPDPFAITLTDSDPPDSEYEYQSDEFSHLECPDVNVRARITFPTDPKVASGTAIGFGSIPLPDNTNNCANDSVSNMSVDIPDVEGEPANSFVFTKIDDGTLVSQRDGTLRGGKTNIYLLTGGAGGQRYTESDGGSCRSYVDISDSDNPDPDAEVLRGVHQDLSGGGPCNLEDRTDVLIRNLTSSKADTDLVGTGVAAAIPSCETEFDGLSDIAWAGCAALRAGDATLRSFDNTIDGLLKVEAEEYDNDGYRTAWNNIRYLATISVVATAMFMVISTALDMGFFSNYTVKKYMPRLVIGTIAIQLSWVIASLLSGLVNELGDGIRLLLSSPFGADQIRDFTLRDIFGSSSVDFGFADVGSNAAINTAAAGAGIVAAKSLGLFGALALLYSGVIFLITAYVFLVFRQIILIAMIIMSPIGVALWILPGSDNAWGLYKKTFLALLMLYPIYITMITIGKIFAFIAISGGTPGQVGVTVFVIGFISYLGGYGSGPFLAKRSLGALSQLTGMVNDRSKGLLDRGRNNLNERGNKRKEFKKGIKSERRAEVASKSGRVLGVPGTRRGALARSRMRTDAGMPITGGIPGTRAHKRASQSMESARNEIFDKEAKEADLALRSSGGYNNTSYLAHVALDKSRSRGERQAALNRVIDMGDDQAVRYIQPRMQTDAVGQSVWQDTDTSGKLFSGFKDKAPDIAKGGASRAHSTSANDRYGWTADTWRQVHQDATNQGNPALMTDVAQRMIDEQKHWDSMSPDVQSYIYHELGLTTTRAGFTAPQNTTPGTAGGPAPAKPFTPSPRP